MLCRLSFVFSDLSFQLPVLASPVMSDSLTTENTMYHFLQMIAIFSDVLVSPLPVNWLSFFSHLCKTEADQDGIILSLC